ncbi:hypothetical protein SAMN05518672_105163 [Chitinophaga sp. CF118]|uniref:carboxypeptidase regulatory-like domain-containing protein n=1 Tax=Chitinophaga sp. CF118 TaxID=1884367 RepID=UPI0008EA1159|nr:carboxypeptidase regulatory-like domain-containing protein [Chitinophaga sp. CF118]SFE28623.1 hypothetical protein SAMN05518672_105163 [Chitinophaga sp. CF118]
MKKISVSILLLATIAVGTFAFKNAGSGSISGKVTPADAASQVWAFQGTDTLKAPVTDGVFNVQGATAGTYTVIVGAKHPFKDVTFTNVKVEDDKTTDLGEIKLQE